MLSATCESQCSSKRENDQRVTLKFCFFSFSWGLLKYKLKDYNLHLLVE